MNIVSESLQGAYEQNRITNPTRKTDQNIPDIQQSKYNRIIDKYFICFP